MPTLDLGRVVGPAGAPGKGDMEKSVYDTKGVGRDIFEYVDEKMQDVPEQKNAITMPGGGTITVPASLGPGPYAIEFTEAQEAANEN